DGDGDAFERCRHARREKDAGQVRNRESARYIGRCPLPATPGRMLRRSTTNRAKQKRQPVLGRSPLENRTAAIPSDSSGDDCALLLFLLLDLATVGAAFLAGIFAARLAFLAFVLAACVAGFLGSVAT